MGFTGFAYCGEFWLDYDFGIWQLVGYLFDLVTVDLLVCCLLGVFVLCLGVACFWDLLFDLFDLCVGFDCFVIVDCCLVVICRLRLVVVLICG